MKIVICYTINDIKYEVLAEGENIIEVEELLTLQRKYHRGGKNKKNK